MDEAGSMDGITDVDRALCEDTLRILGDVPGHEFHGNQHTEGSGGGGKSVASSPLNNAFTQAHDPFLKKGAEHLQKTFGLSSADARKFANYETMHGTAKMKEKLKEQIKSGVVKIQKGKTMSMDQLRDYNQRRFEGER